MSALIWCPFPDTETAKATADALLEERLVACVNILGTMHSMFIWEGDRQSATETGVLMKTHADRLEQAIARIERLHPYDTPAILGWRCDVANEATRAWLADPDGKETSHDRR